MAGQRAVEPPSLAPEDVLAERPFAARIRIREVEPIRGGYRRGSCFLTSEDGRRFKLRACASAAQARRLEHRLRRVAEVFPRLHGREGRYLLFERLEGYRRLDEPSLPRWARAIGRLCATVHTRDAPRARLLQPWRRRVARRTRRRFERELAALRAGGAIDAGLEGRLAACFERGWARRRPRVTLELVDLHPGNLMGNAAGELRFVDEAGLDVAVRGLGFGKLFAHGPGHPGWTACREGYAERCDARYLTEDYLRWLRVVQGVHGAHSKLRRGSPRVAEALESLARAL